MDNRAKISITTQPSRIQILNSIIDATAKCRGYTRETIMVEMDANGGNLLLPGKEAMAIAFEVEERLNLHSVLSPTDFAECDSSDGIDKKKAVSANSCLSPADDSSIQGLVDIFLAKL